MTLVHDENNNRWMIMQGTNCMKIFGYQPGVSRTHDQSLLSAKARATAFITEAAIYEHH